MENPTESDPSPKGKLVRHCFKDQWLFFNAMLFFLGITMVSVGAVTYYQEAKTQYAIILVTGLLGTFTALVVYATKALQRFRLWQQAATEATFRNFLDQSEEATVGKAPPTQSPDLEMNDQHLPSGILRLQEES